LRAFESAAALPDESARMEDDLAAERALTARLHARLAGQDPPGN
jgi:hypothetical protein